MHAEKHTCIHTCIHSYMEICVHVHMLVSIHMHACTYCYMHVYIYIYIYKYMFRFTSMFICVRIYTYVCVHIRANICDIPIMPTALAGKQLLEAAGTLHHTSKPALPGLDAPFIGPCFGLNKHLPLVYKYFSTSYFGSLKY